LQAYGLVQHPSKFSDESADENFWDEGKEEEPRLAPCSTI